MSREPKAGTSFEASAPFFEIVDVPYAFHSDPRTLPQAVMSACVIDEWVAWWHWHIDETAAQTKEELTHEASDHCNDL